VKVLRLICIVLAGLWLAGGIANPAVAAAKIIKVKLAHGPKVAKFKGPRILRYGHYHKPRWRYICCADLDDLPRIRYPYFYAPQPWNERNYLRGPDFPPVNDRIRGVFQPSPTIPNDENIYRQRFVGGPTVEQGSIWAGRFKGGPTVEQGSPWRSRIDY